jgi:hypothetical protein
MTNALLWVSVWLLLNLLIAVLVAPVKRKDK